MNARWTVPLLLAAAMGPMMAPHAALARGPDDHAHNYEWADPESLADALGLIERTLARIESDLMAGGSPEVHNDADAVTRAAQMLGRLALKPGSGVERAKVRDINLQGKALAVASEDLHLAADAKQWEKASAHFTRVREIANSITALAPHRYSAKLALASDAAPGRPGTLSTTLLAPNGSTVTELDIVHEYPLHFMAVSRDFSWYLHDHPARQGDGSFTLPITFPFGGEFRIYHDFTPKGAANQVVPLTVTVPGDAPTPKPLVTDRLELKDIGGGYQARARCNADDYVARKDILLRFTVQREEKPLLDLEPYLGAMGHLVILSEDFKHYVHAHPLSADDLARMKDPNAAPAPMPDTQTQDHSHTGHAHHMTSAGMKHPDDFADSHKSDITFHVNFPAPGMYQAFAQFKHKGTVLTLPWTIRVYPPLASSGHADHAKDK